MTKTRAPRFKTSLLEKLNDLKPKVVTPKLSNAEWRAVFTARKRGIEWSDIYLVIPENAFVNQTAFTVAARHAANRLGLSDKQKDDIFLQKTEGGKRIRHYTVGQRKQHEKASLGARIVRRAAYTKKNTEYWANAELRAQKMREGKARRKAEREAAQAKSTREKLIAAKALTPPPPPSNIGAIVSERAS